MNEIDCTWGPHVEASAPVTVLKNGDWITPITVFPDWNGNLTGKLCGRALISNDKGNTWSDSSICMDFGDKKITCYEQRMCQLESGIIICIGCYSRTIHNNSRCAILISITVWCTICKCTSTVKRNFYGRYSRFS